MVHNNNKISSLFRLPSLVKVWFWCIQKTSLMFYPCITLLCQMWWQTSLWICIFSRWSKISFDFGVVFLATWLDIIQIFQLEVDLVDALSWMPATLIRLNFFLSFFLFKTVCWKTLKRSVLPKGTAASDNNYLWVCHYKQPPSHYTSIFHCSYNTYWLVCGFKGKSIFLDSAFCADIQQSYLGKLY